MREEWLMSERLGFVVSAAAVAVAVITAPVAAAPRGQLSPIEQRMVDAQLAAPKLDPKAQPTDISVRYHSAVAGQDALATMALVHGSVEDALNLALRSKALAFRATGPRSIFVYPDTPANREKYTDSVRTFPITKA